MCIITPPRPANSTANMTIQTTEAPVFASNPLFCPGFGVADEGATLGLAVGVGALGEIVVGAGGKTVGSGIGIGIGIGMIGGTACVVFVGLGKEDVGSVGLGEEDVGFVGGTTGVY